MASCKGSSYPLDKCFPDNTPNQNMANNQGNEASQSSRLALYPLALLLKNGTKLMIFTVTKNKFHGRQLTTT